MRILGRFFTLVALALALLLPTVESAMSQPKPLDPENTIYLQLKDGTVVIRLRPDLAPTMWPASRS
jgi:hypothetical protein